MKRRIFPPLLCLMLLCVGCTTPTDRWAAGRSALNAAQDTLVSLNKTGVLPDADFVATEKYDKTAREALDLAAKELPAGGNRFTFWMNIVESAASNLAPKNTAKLVKSP